MIQKLMWAIKSPHGELVRMEYSESEHGAWRLWAYAMSVEYSGAWAEALRKKGYRAIQVQVKEIG